MSLYLMPVGEGRRIPIKKTVVFIGRHPDCDVVLTKSLKVSRRHCCLALVDDKLFVRDLGSTNGIQVNGKRVKREEQLRLGDELIVGDVAFILKAKRSIAGEAQSEDAQTGAGPGETGNSVPGNPDETSKQADQKVKSGVNVFGLSAEDLGDDPAHDRFTDSEADLQERSVFEMREGDPESDLDPNKPG